MIELVNLEECVGYVVKVNHRNDTIRYGKIEVVDGEDYDLGWNDAIQTIKQNLQ